MEKNKLLKPLKRGTLQFIFSLCNMSQNSVIRGAREVRLVSNISRFLRAPVTKSGAHAASKGDSGGDNPPPTDTSVRSLWVTCIQVQISSSSSRRPAMSARHTNRWLEFSRSTQAADARVCIIMHDALFAIEITGGGEGLVVQLSCQMLAESGKKTKQNTAI